MARARSTSLADLSGKFISKTLRYRGDTYVITELSMKAYDKTVKQATETIKDEELGTSYEKTDNDKHTRILLSRCVTRNGEPIDVDEFYDSGARLVRQVIRDLGEIFYGDENETDEDEVKEDDLGEVTAEAKS